MSPWLSAKVSGLDTADDVRAVRRKTTVSSSVRVGLRRKYLSETQSPS